jgi:hypothetical protein
MHGPQETHSSRKDMRCLQQAVQLAKKVEERMGRSQILQRAMSSRCVLSQKAETR